MRFVEQHRHLAHDRAGFADAGDNRLALEHLEPSLHQYIKMPGGAALADDHRACGDVPLTSTCAVIENPAHRYLRPFGKIRRTVSKSSNRDCGLSAQFLGRFSMNFAPANSVSKFSRRQAVAV